MPESSPHSFEKSPEAQLAVRMAEVRENVTRKYDELVANGEDPYTAIRQDDYSHGREVYGDTAIDHYLEVLETLRGVNREEFIEQLVSAIGGIVQAEYSDPEVQARMEVRRQRSERQKEFITFGHLQASLHDFDLPNVVEGETTHLHSADKVLEISWPGDAQAEKPGGVHDVEESFREMAKYVASHPEIKAVIAVSWMMSRGIAKRLGFQVHPEIPIETEQQQNVTDWATKARQDKPYVKGVKPHDVQLGQIPREAFLQRYG